MRFGNRADRDVDADGTAPCGMCQERVLIDISGRCELGHRVLSPEAAERALACDESAGALAGGEQEALESGAPHFEPTAEWSATEADADSGSEGDPAKSADAVADRGEEPSADRGEEPSGGPQPGLDIENLLRDGAHLN